MNEAFSCTTGKDAAADGGDVVIESHLCIEGDTKIAAFFLGKDVRISNSDRMLGDLLHE